MFGTFAEELTDVYHDCLATKDPNADLQQKDVMSYSNGNTGHHIGCL